MYRRSKKYQQQVACLAAVQADREQKQLDGTHPVVQTNLPELRRIIEITSDYSAHPVLHPSGQLKLFKNVPDIFVAWRARGPSALAK